MKKIIYIANMRLPSERAHSVHVMEMCAALATTRPAKVFLVVPRRKTDVEAKNIHNYYGVSDIFPIIRRRSLDLFPYSWIPRRFAYYIHAAFFALSVWSYARRFPDAVILSRDLLSAWLLSFRHTVAFEVHDLPGKNPFGQWMLRKLPYVITTNQRKKERLISEFGIDPKKIYIAPNAVDVEKFIHRYKTMKTTAELEAIGWPQNRRVVLYAGSLFPWKGVSTLVRATKFLPPNMNTMTVIVGGNDDERWRLREFIFQEGLDGLVKILPHQPHAEIPALLAEASVLVLPTSGKTQIGREDTSPIKAFEYLAAAKPIVASDVPSSHEVLDETMAVFFRADDPEDCAKAITRALSLDPVARDTMFAAQQTFICEHTWNARAQAILNFLSV